jgi:hypothetical protein
MHRADFQKLVALAAEDPGFPRIDAGQIPPRGMTRERSAEYRRLFKQLSIGNGLNRYAAYPAAVFLLADSRVPIGGKSQSDGYVYSTVPLVPLVSTLPLPAPLFEVHHGSGHRIAFRRLDGPWYIFCDADW